MMSEVMTMRLQGATLALAAADPLLADHLWRQQGRLLQFTGCQHLQLLLELPSGPLAFTWAPPPLPACLFPIRRRQRRGLQP
jgi:hypothetical protein